MRVVGVVFLFALIAACGERGEADGTANEVPLTPPAGVSPAPGVFPFQGTWAGEGASCADAGLDLENGPLTITTRTVRYADAPCAIEMVEELPGDAVYQVFLRCSRTGGSDDIDRRFAVVGDTLTITSDDGAESLYRRCEPSSVGE